MSNYNKEIGRRIYEKRLENRLSRGDLLEYVNISEVYLGMIERETKDVLRRVELFVRGLSEPSVLATADGLIHSYARTLTDFEPRRKALRGSKLLPLNAFVGMD